MIYLTTLFLLILLLMISLSSINFNKLQFVTNGNLNPLRKAEISCRKNNIKLANIGNVSRQYNLKNDYYQTIFSSINSPLVIINHKCEVIDSNTSFRKFFYSLFKFNPSNDYFLYEETSFLGDFLKISLSDMIKRNLKEYYVEKNLFSKNIQLFLGIKISTLNNGMYLVTFTDKCNDIFERSNELFSNSTLPVIIEKSNEIIFANKSSLNILDRKFNSINKKSLFEFLNKIHENKYQIIDDFSKSKKYVKMHSYSLNNYCYYFLQEYVHKDIDSEYISNYISEKKILEFTTKAAHDLKAPLNVIYSITQLYKKSLFSDNFTKEKQNELIEVIESNCFRQLKLIHNIEELDKLENNLYEQNKYFYKLDSIVEYFINSLRKVANAKCIEINFIKKEKDIIGFIDINSLERIIFNILTNSIKFTPSGGTINVSIDKDIDNINISIEDNGVGVRESELKNIFNKYHEFGKKNVYGSDLSLYIAKFLTNLNDGTLSIESSYLNGSTFYLKFPNIDNVPESFSLKTYPMTYEEQSLIFKPEFLNI